MEIKRKIRGRLRAVLDDSGLDWTAERGSKHIKIYVAGRMAGVVGARGNVDKGDVGDRFAIANVRRAIQAAGGKT